MERELFNRTLRLIGIGLLAGSVLFLPSCDGKGSTPAPGRIAPKPDPLLGKWVMLADNGTGEAGTIADYRPDGTVVITQKGKKETARYKREPGKNWVDRRAGGPDTKDKEMREAMAPFRKPGVEMIEFAGPDGKFMDYGGTLLTLDPGRRILYNPLTQLWCRPGEEARAKAEFDGK